MKTHIAVLFKLLVLSSVASLQFQHVAAQKKTRIITTDIFNKINEIVKPVQEQLEKVLKDDPTYKEYEEEVYALNKLETDSEKSKSTAYIKEKYGPFFKSAWSALKIDEASYQEQLRDVFPTDLREKIVFQEYLNFSIIVPYFITGTEPLPDLENKCVDVCTIAAGEVTGTGGLIASGAGSYGNCFIKASSWALIAGRNVLKAELKNNITIPGTFPADQKKLRVKISFDTRQEATAIALFGTSIATTQINTFNGMQELYAIAPVAWITSLSASKSYSEEYVIEKNEISKSIISAFAESVSVLITGNWSFSECNNIKWSVCEVK